MIGLRSGRVRLLDVHEEAVFDYARAYGRLKTVFPAFVAIEHVGSTAVPGLAAKPVVDIAIGLASSLTVETAVRLMSACGYRYRGFRADAGGHICDFLVGELTTRHVHIVQAGSERWYRYIVFRDFLRASASARIRYQEHNRILARRFPANRREYTANKVEFVESLTDEGLEWFRNGVAHRTVAQNSETPGVRQLSLRLRRSADTIEINSLGRETPMFRPTCADNSGHESRHLSTESA